MIIGDNWAVVQLKKEKTNIHEIAYAGNVLFDDLNLNHDVGILIKTVQTRSDSYFMLGNQKFNYPLKYSFGFILTNDDMIEEEIDHISKFYRTHKVYISEDIFNRFKLGNCLASLKVIY